MFAHSPYLTRLAQRFPDYASGDFARVDALFSELKQSLAPDISQVELMQRLRIAKGKLALALAACDISGSQSLNAITGALSQFADMAVRSCLAHVLHTAEKRGDITPPPKAHGIFILGMGKLGAFELNYSSDIDLIVFFEKNRLEIRGRLNEQALLNRMVQDLVFMMQERTEDGYVFRTDLRLRPDPASTPPAVSVPAAMTYYESVGQNWERAAMIKARVIAGDEVAGAAFMKYLTPFMWRRTLDFAAIQDILSIKRQMDHREGTQKDWAGYNVKLGQGGIREIEFFVQVHQLIWGGRKQELRTRATLDTLTTMQHLGLITKDEHDELHNAYHFLRTLEHRLQMVDDQQTHSLPESMEAMHAIADFMGYTNSVEFLQILRAHTARVHHLFTHSFKSQELSGTSGNLVFTGVSHDPNTLASLEALGYHTPETISDIIMSWHHGNRRATRTKRSREVLTELVPAILEAFSKVPEPDDAFLHFDQLIATLPAGVQIFSLFANSPKLLELVARIMGQSPYLKENLIKHPDLIESVLLGGFYDALPEAAQLKVDLRAMLQLADDFEEQMDTLRRFKNEKTFQAGVQFLHRMASAQRAGSFLADVADVVLQGALECVEKEFEASYGTIEGAQFCVLGLGRLGARNMTFGSDIDLVFVYDVPDFEALSSGEKSFTAGVYYNRLCQRLLSALTTITQNGVLYEVDTRLRPSGKQGLLAVSRKAFSYYFAESAWAFECMALSKARVVAGSVAGMAEDIERILRTPRDVATLKSDIHAMRERTEAEFKTENIWDVKHIRGGLMDLDFIAQWRLLSDAHAQPNLLQRDTGAILLEAKENALADAYAFLNQLFQWLRITASKANVDEESPRLQAMLAEGMGMEHFAALREALVGVEAHVNAAYTATFL